VLDFLITARFAASVPQWCTIIPYKDLLNGSNACCHRIRYVSHSQSTPDCYCVTKGVMYKFAAQSARWAHIQGWQLNKALLEIPLPLLTSTSMDSAEHGRLGCCTTHYVALNNYKKPAQIMWHFTLAELSLGLLAEVSPMLVHPSVKAPRSKCTEHTTTTPVWCCYLLLVGIPTR
jgi:hypothetical protein